MVADEAGLQLGGMMDNVGTVGNTIPERKSSSYTSIPKHVILELRQYIRF